MDMRLATRIAALALLAAQPYPSKSIRFVVPFPVGFSDAPALADVRASLTGQGANPAGGTSQEFARSPSAGAASYANSACARTGATRRMS
jgi:hypothetical protein